MTPEPWLFGWGVHKGTAETRWTQPGGAGNPKPETRNKSKFMEMREWRNGESQNFVAACEQSGLLQCREKSGVVGG